MSRTPHITIRSGGPASWAIRLVATAVVVWLVLWIPTSASDSLVDTCTTALVWMSAAMALNLLVGALIALAVPMVLERVGRDPAIGSSVLLTFSTDSMGFFIFLGLATLFFT